MPGDTMFADVAEAVASNPKVIRLFDKEYILDFLGDLANDEDFKDFFKRANAPAYAVSNGVPLYTFETVLRFYDQRRADIEITASWGIRERISAFKAKHKA